MLEVIPSSGSPTQRLANMGFRKCGAWRLEHDCIKCTLVDPAPAKNVLYEFICKDQVLYIGKTVGSLTKRMHYYQKPGPSQSTNNYCNSRIREIPASGAMVEVHALPDNGLLYYGGFHVNLAAGLEDNLVATFKPKWNRAGI